MIDSEILPTLKGERIRLRWLTERDVDALFSIFSDPKVMKYWSWLPFEDAGAAANLLADIREGFQKQNLFQWGIARQIDDRVIGTCTLSRIDANNRRAEIGYALGSDYWGNGYMQEALTLLFDFSFGQLNFHRLEADVDPQNASSIKILERLGFQKEGYLRERWLIGGGVYDSLFFGLLRREWLDRRKS
jgi:RimJ/RimL family protein N-acetyltransferase